MCVSPLAFGQSPYTTTPGAYVGLQGLPTVGSRPGEAAGARTDLGYRLGSGVDLGVHVGVSHEPGGGLDGATSAATRLRVGPTVGYTRPLSERLHLRTEGRLGVDLSHENADWRLDALNASARTDLFARVPLGRRVTLLPTVGVYAEASRLSPAAYHDVRQRYAGVVADDPSGLPFLGGPARTYTDLGFQVGLPLSVGLTDRVVLVLEPFLRYGLWNFDNRAGAGAGLGVRLNF